MKLKLKDINRTLAVKQKFSSLLLLFFAISFFSAVSGAVARQPTPAELEAIQNETRLVFQDFLQLWQEERYFELYKYGKQQSTNQITIEEFATRMVELDWVPVGLLTEKNPEISYRYRTLLYVNAAIVFRHKSNFDLQFTKQQSFCCLRKAESGVSIYCR